MRDQKIISFSHQNLSYTQRYFAEHGLVRNIAYSCDDTFALISLVLAGLGIPFASQSTGNFSNRNFELRKVRGVDFRIGTGVAWNMDDPTASRDDIIEIARSLVRPLKLAPGDMECDFGDSRSRFPRCRRRGAKSPAGAQEPKLHARIPEPWLCHRYALFVLSKMSATVAFLFPFRKHENFQVGNTSFCGETFSAEAPQNRLRLNVFPF